MTAPHADLIVNGYLALLEGEARALPRVQSSELLENIREHIAEARSRLADETDADLLALLDRLGDPADVAGADDARRDAPSPRAHDKRQDRASPILLMITWSLGLALAIVVQVMHAVARLAGDLDHVQSERVSTNR
jgi:uncharacterized membrane protein